MYADDSQGRLPDRTADDRWDLKLGVGRGLPIELLKCPNDRSIVPDETQRSGPSQGKTTSAGRSQQKISDQVRIGSYLMNGFTDVMSGGQSGNIERGSSYGMLLTGVFSPSKTLLYGEKSSNSSAFYADVLPMSSDYLEHVDERRHIGKSVKVNSDTDWSARSNYSFVDGHIEAIQFGKATCPENLWCVSDEWRLNAALCRPRF